MSNAVSSPSDRSTTKRIRSSVSAVWGRVSLKVAAVGVAFILTGYVLRSGVWAGLLPIWGVALLAVGLGLFGLTRRT